MTGSRGMRAVGSVLLLAATLAGVGVSVAGPAAGCQIDSYPCLPCSTRSSTPPTNNRAPRETDAVFTGTAIGPSGTPGYVGSTEFARFAVEVDAVGRGSVGREVVVDQPLCSDWDPTGQRYVFTAIRTNPHDEDQVWKVTDARPATDGLPDLQWAEPDASLPSGWAAVSFRRPHPLEVLAIPGLILGVVACALVWAWMYRRDRQRGG